MDFKCQQQQRMEKDEDVSLPKKSCTEFAFDVCEPTAIVESKNRHLENLRQRLEEIEVEADELRHAMSKLEKEIGKAQGIIEGTTAGSAEGVKLEPKVEIKEEQDTRSIFVGNVDYACMPEEVQQHFQSCGTINRVTIMTDKFGQPRGFAYVEFVDDDAVQNALLLNETELHGRQLKVCVKRTNIPGMNQYLGMRPIPYYGYGSFPRFKRPMYYKPY